MAELPVITFIQERLAEADSTLETRDGTGFYDLFVKPQQFMLNPLLSSMETTLIAQSVRRLRNLTDPNAFDETLVEDAVGNVYVTRESGSYARATVRVFYSTPVDREFPALAAQFTSGALSFFNEFDIVITAQQMSTQQVGTLYYMDVPAIAETQGASYNVEIGAITQFVNDPQAVSVTNSSKASSGVNREDNVTLLDRARNSIGVRDLETIKGINAILNEKFPYLVEIQSIGMGDPEMMRDILYNVHCGGNTDVYLKTPSLQKLTANFIGVDFDYTRKIARNVHMELIAQNFTDPLSDLNTPNIVSPSVTVKEDIIETSASVSSLAIGSGIDLSLGQYIRLSIDGGAPVNIKVAGGTPSATQRYEIIDSINAAFGIIIAATLGTDRILLQSPTTGTGSNITFSTPTVSTDGTLLVFPNAGTLGGYVSGGSPGIFDGVAAIIYTENVDYQVDYANGKIIKIVHAGPHITSGEIVAEMPGPLLSGYGNITLGSNLFNSPIVGAFTNVHAGDTLNVTLSTGTPVGEYVVQEVISDMSLKIAGLSPSVSDFSVEYNIVSNQTVILDYQYNPVSIDIGGMVLLSDGITRGVRPGRDLFTITDLPFVGIYTIEEIDSFTGENLGIFLNPPGGFGKGGFGSGGFGRSQSGDYQVLINEPTTRFSMFEDALIVLNSTLAGRSYQVTYYASPEIAGIHTVARNDLERVTGADVLPKNFIPGFVDITIGIRRDITNTATPTNAVLASMVAAHVETVKASVGLKESDIIKLLEAEGVDSVQTPFTMYATVLNTDGSTSIYSDQDILTVPSVTLAKDTPNYGTPRITHYYARNISVVEV